MPKNILITGASGNLGKATVKQFALEGYNIIVTVPPGKTLGYDGGENIDIHEVDLTNENAVHNTVKKIIARHQNIDAALLLAGGYAYGGIAATDGSAIKRMMSLNFDTAYFVVRPVFEQMLAQQNGGRLIFIGSKPALNSAEGKNSLAYALSKTLLFKLADCLNEEGASKNVTASVIAPSIIDTEPNRHAMPDADFSRWVKPEEIAEVMAFLCSERGIPLRNTVLKVYGKS